MTDLERLNEAIATFDSWRHMIEEKYPETAIFVSGALKTYATLAEAARLVANGERVEWCETHGYPRWHGHDLLHDAGICEYAMHGSHRPCSFVSRLLVDPPNEEDR